MNKIRVIDLLNKIENGEAFPSDILIKGRKFEYNWHYESIEQLYRDDIGIDWFDVIDINLNTEVEIIEEPKKIEKLETYEISSANHYDNESTLLEKINEIIDYINKEQE